MRFSESGSRFAAYSMADPDHQTRLSGKRLSEFGLAICVLVDLVDRLTAPTCARGGVSSVLSGRSRIDLNQRDIRRRAQRSCGRRVCLPRPTESAPSRTAFLLCPPTSPPWKAFCRHTGPGHVRYFAGPYGPTLLRSQRGVGGGGSYGRSLVLLGPSRVQEFPKLLAGIIAPSVSQQPTRGMMRNLALMRQGTGPGSAALRFKTDILRLDRPLALAIIAMFSRRALDFKKPLQTGKPRERHSPNRQSDRVHARPEQSSASRDETDG